ncbi:MAG: type II secretion system protein GspC [Steroidobacteraceae bacterium]
MNAAAWYEELKSGPGWSRLVGQRATQVVVAVLLIALAIDCALILTRALGQSALPSSSAGGRLAPPPPAVNPTVELATVVNAHLFGVSGAQAGSNAPQTTMPLILAGVIADKDPARGQAIIGDSASSAKLIAVGAMIPGGARLHAVYGDRVLIERNGRVETLMLPRTPMKGGPIITPAPAAATPAVMRDNSTVLAGLVRVQPVFNQGKLSGYRIFPGGSRGNSTFSQLGLRPGDLITAINGTPLDDAARAMEVLQTLSSSASATITVTRNGASQDMNLNLANLSTEMESTPGENPASAGGNVPPNNAVGPIPFRNHGGGPAQSQPAVPPPEAPAAGNAAANSER